MKLCSYILCSYRHITAKYCLIILKCDEVVISNATTPRFFTWLKIFTNSIETRTRNKLYNYFLQQSTTNCIFNVTLCSKCSPLACMHAFWRFVNSLMALLLLLLARWLLVTHCHSLSAPAWRSTADPVASTRWQICCTVLNFHGLCGYMHELLLLLRIPAHALSAFAFCPHATSFPLWLR